MSHQIRFILPAIWISLALFILGCSSTEEQGLTLKNVQDIGFQTEEDITKQYWKFQDLSEAWNGNILVKDEDEHTLLVYMDDQYVGFG